MVAGFAFGRRFNDNSYLWHVRAGDLQIERGSVLTADPFSFTKLGEPWRTQSWLADVLYSLLDDVAGLEGSPFITASCAALTFLLLGLIAFRRSKSLVSVVMYLVASAVALAAFLNPRPVIFSFPLFAAVVLADDDRRTRWMVPFLLWVWASVHGSFFIGLAYLGSVAMIRGIDRRALARLLCAACVTLLTAHGLGIVEILLDFGGNRQAVAVMSEWATPNLLSPPFIPVFLGILALVFLAQQGELGRREWLLVAPFLALALTANRSVPPAWIALSPVLSRVKLPINPNRRGSPVAVVLALGLLVFPFLLRPAEFIDSRRFPVAAAAHLTGHRVFHDDAVGGWLIYHQWPERQVYIDDRAELYGEQMLTFVDTRLVMKPWEREFEKWAIDQALLRPTDPLTQLLEASAWKETYRDENFVILRKP